MTQAMGRARRARTMVAVVALLAVAIQPSGAAIDEPDVPKVLVYSGTQAYRHASINHGNPILAKLAQDTGAFTIDFTENPAVITPETLSNYDVVLFNSPSGVRTGASDWPAEVCSTTNVLCDRAPFSAEQRADFMSWISCGGGFVGIHQAMDAWHDWPEWNELVGMIFFNHFSAAEAEIIVTADGPISAPFGAPDDVVRINDEHYTFLPGNGPQDLSSDVEVVLGIGEFTDPNTELRQGGFYGDRGPVAWTSTFRGRNRTFMTNLGHMTTTWDMPAYQAHLLAGILHVAEQRPDADCVAAI